MRFSALIAFCLFGGSVYSASPRDELLKRVPNDVGFVVVVNDFRGQLDRMQNSPFAKKYLLTARGKAAFSSPQWEQLNAVNDLLKREIGADWPELRDGILGDAVVFLYVPGPPEHPEQEESLVLIHARNPQLAQRIYTFIDDAQSKAGQLKEKTTQTRGDRSFVKRVRTDEDDEYTYIHGSLIAFGKSERLLHAVMDRDQKPEDSKIAQEIDRLGIGSAGVLWWMNPRAFDNVMAFQQKKETGPAAAALAALNQHWKALDGIALSYHLNHDSEFRLSLAARPEAMPASTRQFLTELATPSTLTTIFPKDALVTITGRVSIPAAMNFGAEFLPVEARSQLRQVVQKSIGAILGDDVIAVLPERLGPDWGMCVMAPAKDNKSEWPIAVAAIRLGDAPDGPAVIARVMDGLNALATLAVVGFNSKNPQTISLHAERQDSIDVRYIIPPKEIPADLRPAFAWKDGYLVLASHPDGIRQFSPKTATTTPASEMASVLQFNLPAWAGYLRSHRGMAVSLLTKQDGLTSEVANGQLDAALEVLDMFQGVSIAVKTQPGRATVSLQVKPTESFVRPEK